MIRVFKTLTVLGCAALLASCGPLISFGDNEPDIVYSLTYNGDTKGTPTGPKIFVSEPSFADGLGGRGVRVRLTDYELTTVNNLRWSTDISSLLRDYLVLALRDKGNAQMLGEDTLDVAARCRLNSYVWEMSFVPGALPDDDRVTMRIEYSLVDIISGSLIGRKIAFFDRSVDGSSKGIIRGFNEGMDEMVDDIGKNWLISVSDRCV